ncbi:MAG: peptidase T, partial [Angelakisella sp.]
QYVGQDIITSDGTTLLGADDKAGIAEIMAMADYLLSHTEIIHGKIAIAFTPDEEVGNGVEHFDVAGFGADFAYTVDGGELGELEYENFNAASAKVVINGVSIHPGAAKGKMKNALLIAMELQQLLPAHQNPAYTEGYEGFFHLDELHGDVERAHMDYIIRDHGMLLFEQKKEQFAAVCAFLNTKYGAGTVEVNLKDSYYNMKEQVLPHFHLIENAKAVMEELGITPIVTPIRGGTDGSRLSFMGLPCPNLCTGGHNFHGRYEYIPTQSMERIVELLVKLTERYGA